MAIADVKTIRIFKTFGGAGTKGEFSNTYHALSPGSLKEDGLVRLAQRLALAERNITSDRVFFKRAIISTYARKSAVGGSDKPYIVKINQTGAIDFTAPQGASLSRFLPPEACLVMDFGGGLGRPGSHTYRYAIGPDDWRNMGGGVELMPDIFTRANNAFNGILDPQFGFPPLVFLTEDEDGQPTDPVTSISCSGYRLRQLTQKKGKKKTEDIFDPIGDDDADAAEQLAQAVEVFRDIDINRYTEKGATFFNSAKVASAAAAIASAYQLWKAAKDTNDYGPQVLGGGV